MKQFDPLAARKITLSGNYFADCDLLANVIAKDMAAYEQLEQERNELAAQVEQLSGVLLECKSEFEEFQSGRMTTAYGLIKDALSETPFILTRSPESAAAAYSKCGICEGSKVAYMRYGGVDKCECQRAQEAGDANNN